MNSVALPASATSSNTLGTEADIVRQAARGDVEAFGELFRRHGSPAWRLAQAVSCDADTATAAFRAGFVRAVRAGRLARRAPGAFRGQVLAAVYRTAIDAAYDRAAAPAPARRPAGADPETALAYAAFRSLPERWRAALWLSEVENLSADRIAGVLGVSAAVAEQLVARGRRGLAGRFSQAHHEAPAHVGEALRSLAIPMPADLAETTAAGWSAAGTDHLSALAPAATWLEERASRPMSVAVGALIGLGLIGLGVVPGGSTVRSQLQSISPSSVNGAVPVHTCFGLACSGQDLGGLQATDSGFLASSFSGGAAGGSGAGGGSGTGGSGFFSGTGPGAGSFGPGGSAPGSGIPGTPGGPSAPSVPGVPSGPSVPSAPSVPSVPGVPSVPTPGSTILDVPGVATVTNSSGTLSTSLLGGTATASAGSGGLSTSVGTTTVTVPLKSGTSSTQNTSTSSASTTTTTLGLLPAVGSAISGAISGL